MKRNCVFYQSDMRVKVQSKVTYRLAGIEQTLALPSIACVLQFSDVYRHIEFEHEA